MDVFKNIPDESVDLLLCDPPYPTTKRGCSGGTGGILKTEDAKKGKMFKHNVLRPKDYLSECFRVMKDGAHGYLFSNDVSEYSLKTELKLQGFKIFKTLIWNKNNKITNMYYMGKHEYIVFFRKGKAKKINNCGTPSVLDFKNPKNKKHPSEKPVELLELLVLNSSVQGDLILDFAMGSGSTGVACCKANRDFIGIEIDPEYFAIAQERLKKQNHE